MEKARIFANFLRLFRAICFVMVAFVFGTIGFARAEGEITYPFSITTTNLSAGDTFRFNISAAGTFYVDCGTDGTLSGTGVSGGTITKSNTNGNTYTCTYTSGGAKTIRFGGTATGYSTNNATAAISFDMGNYNAADSLNVKKISAISGSLGQIFGTVENPLTGSGQPKFHYAFIDASNMTGTNIDDPNNPGMKYALPPTLFDGIYGAPAEHMFDYTFGGCSGLTGSIPSGLFGNLSGAPAQYMFDATFSGCSGLTGSIPDGLFGNISGTPAEGMFYGTFGGCSGLTGSIPSGLFGNISGAPAKYMFYGTFGGCSGLNGFGDKTYVPGDFLADIDTNTSVSYQAISMFANTQLDNPCPAGTYTVTREQFNDAGKPWCTPCPGGTTSPAGATDVSQCVRDYPFSLTTTELSVGDTFRFKISAAGTFYIDCGVGGTLTSTTDDISGPDTNNVWTITRSSTDYATYTCTYSNAGTKTVQFGGAATGYSTSHETAAIRFNISSDDSVSESSAVYFAYSDTNAALVSSISGNLSEIFPYLGSDAGQQPGFSKAFRGCVNLTSIPGDLFANITTGADYMFFQTFQRCESVPSIPNELFSRITSGGIWMFRATFESCYGLTFLPDSLFSGITSGYEKMFRDTFEHCKNLSGYVPPSLFAGLIANGHPYADGMMDYIFYGTKLDTSCPTGTQQYITGYESYWYGLAPSPKVSCYCPGDTCYNVTYMCGAGTGDAPLSNAVAVPGETFTLIENTCTPPSGYRFDGWAVSGTDDVKPANVAFTWEYDEDKILTAQYETDQYKDEDYPFLLTTTELSAGDTFQFSISAVGIFYIDCGDGGTLSGNGVSGYTITKSNINKYTYTCTYTNAGTHTIQFGGHATGYNNTTDNLAAISFNVSGNYNDTNVKKISAISGSLGQIFGTITNSSAWGRQPNFKHTFYAASNMTGTNIDDPNNPGMKYALPPTLFDGISGAPANAMFFHTFDSCGITGSIPSGLFGNISGTPTAGMFGLTFAGCWGLTGSIPSTLFGNLSGAPAVNMFYGTFMNCSGLTGFGDKTYVPGDFLADIDTNTSVSSQATSMFTNTQLDNPCPAGTYTVTRTQFNNAGKPWCTPCPDGTTSPAGATSVNQCGVGYAVTYNCGSGSGNAPTTNTSAIENLSFTPAANTCIPPTNGVFTGWLVSGTEDILQPSTAFTWGYGSDKTLTAQYVIVDYPFSLTTTELSENDTFKFNISAAGTFYVDCGTDGTLSGTGVSGDTITKSNTNNYTYTCVYTSGGAKTIRFGGHATGYYNLKPAIDFNISISSTFTDTNVKKISSISGSLGQIFGTIENPPTGFSGQPNFQGTFYAASNMTGTNIDDPNNPGMKYALPPTLFNGVSGAPISNMFRSTFSSCRGLTGSIPSTLFDGISGAPAEHMFQATFNSCRGLTGSIPSTLFNGISGAPASGMFAYTFSDCIGLTGSIPSTLFNGISGAPANQMFYGTFSSCIGLTGSIPSTLFNGISGAPASEMFTSTFNSCSRLNGFGDKTYVPGDFLADIDTNTSVSNQALDMFYGTQLADPCPAGTYTVTREQFNNAGKPWCTPCPDGTTSSAGATDVSQCVEPYNVIYDCGDGTGDAPSTTSVVPNGAFVPSANTCTPPTNGLFTGWLVSGTENIVQPGSEIMWDYNTDKTLIAQYITVGDFPFSITTTELPAEYAFVFTMGANGDFYIDCGNGGTLVFVDYENPSGGGDSGGGVIKDKGEGKINAKMASRRMRATPTFTRNASRLSGIRKSSTNSPSSSSNTCPSTGTATRTINGRTDNTDFGVYACYYETGGEKTIRFGGTATGYTPVDMLSLFGSPINIGCFPSTIAFIDSSFDIANIDGDLSAMFPYLGAEAGEYPIFLETFAGSYNLTSVPDTLFGGYTNGAPYMFVGTFVDSGLTSLPGGLFDNITTGAEGMFFGTFGYCENLRSIPENLFANITTAADGMFMGTFAMCPNLTGFVPPTLFAGLIENGSPMPEMMAQSSLLNGMAGDEDFSTSIFAETSLRTRCPARYYQYITGYEDYWDGKVSCKPCPDGTTSPVGSTDISQCVEQSDPGENEYKFSIITTDLDDGDSFEFYLSAAGTFYVDCGEGGILYSSDDDIYDDDDPGDISGGGDCKSCVIKDVDHKMASRRMRATPTFTRSASRLFSSSVPSIKSSSRSTDTDVTSGTEIYREDNTNLTAYACIYSTGGEKTIRFGGRATGYTDADLSSAGEMATTIIFDSRKISDIDGSLSAIFPNFGPNNGEHPMFFGTFANMWGNGESSPLTSIPDTLFSGYTTGAPYMFAMTFNGSSLTSIPENLFANITTGAEGMFLSTFAGCENLTSIPENLFANITTGAEGMFLGTFTECENLRSIPENLFANITTAADGMFVGTFAMCSNLTGFVPPTLFAGLIENGSPMPEMMAQSSLLSNQTVSVFVETSMDTECPENYYQYITGYEDYWDDRVSCKPCPNGGTSPAGSTSVDQCVEPAEFVCESGKYLHIGEDKMCLTKTKPHTRPLLVTKIGNKQYYLRMTPSEVPINNTSNKKFNVLHNGMVYRVFDESMWDEMKGP